MGTNKQKSSADAAEGWQDNRDPLDKLVTDLFILARHTPQGQSALQKMRERLEEFMEGRKP